MKIILAAIIFLAISCNNNADESEKKISVETDTLEIIEETLEQRTEELPMLVDTLPPKKIKEPVASPPNEEKMQQKHPQVTVEQEALQKLLGKWQWTKTVCCGRNAQVYNDTLVQKRILHFRKNGTVDFYSGNKLEKTESFKISTGTAYRGRAEITIGDKTHGPALIEFENNDQELILNYGWMDLQVEQYKKIQ